MASAASDFVDVYFDADSAISLATGFAY